MIGYIAILVFAIAPFALAAFWYDLVGPSALFWYRKDEIQGHMLCHLGWRYHLVLFGKWITWEKKNG